MLFKKQFLRVLLNIDSFIIVYFLKNNIFVTLFSKKIIPFKNFPLEEKAFIVTRITSTNLS